MMITKLIAKHATLCVAIAALSATAHASTTYDAVRDFSIKANPNGVWSYQDSANLAYAHRKYQGVLGLENWSDDLPREQGVMIARNKTGAPVTLNNGTLTIPTNYLLLDPEHNTPGAIVTFTAPVAGTYTAKGDFLGLDTDGARYTHAIIYYNADDHGSGDLYDQFMHNGKTAKFKVTQAMQAGDTLGFFIERNSKNRPDDIGLAVKITGP
jgi:hypothetical protein